jgi:DNA/RNA endonuclease YhcR with UshA esterase domain
MKMKAISIENNTIRSFNVLKRDIRKLAVWVAWNRREHELLKERITKLEAKLNAARTTKFVGSIKSRRVHSTNCLHAKRIKQTNKTYFDILRDAEELGYSLCDCTA